MSNVVNFNGDEVLLPMEPCDELVSRLEDLLERAKSGDIHGISAVLTHGDGSVSIVRTLTPNYRAIGAVFSMATDMAKEID
jgi:hypothetical protein